MQQLSLNGAWEFRQANTIKWLPAQVPGGAHTDLMAAGRIPDPFVGDNEIRVKWVAESDWEYRKVFSVSEELLHEDKVYLVCDGLDTLASLALNGAPLGKTNNMFRQYRWEVKSVLHAGENELVVYFESSVQYITIRQNERPLLNPDHSIPGGPYIRKAPCQFGWDWGPKLPPVGIWKDIRLEGYNLGRIADVHLRQQHNNGKVAVKAALAADRWSDKPLQARLTVISPEGEVKMQQLDLQNGASDLEVTVENPQLWWPNGYGRQPLYQVDVLLLDGETVLDQRAYQLGLRTLELRQEPDEWGQSFTFVVNGVPIFAKGSNWIPADSFPTRITFEQLDQLLGAAVATHQNMLRVWGGGFFEDERFYDLCDRYGILVWQDFIFSCSMYPMDDPEFMENVREEIHENVRRLRHRTSLALWCGNNEMEWGVEAWEQWVKELGGDRSALDLYRQFFYHTLPQWVAELDPDRAYWPSSPSSNEPFQDPNGQVKGDAHYWDVWHGRKPFTAYRQQYPRFMSEFGFQSLPPLNTVATYAPRSEWNMTSYIMELHQKNKSGNGLIVGQMTDTFRMPKDFEAMVYLTMVLQAEGIRYGVEHWRRNKHRVSGTLYWQLNDCWPVASWSSLDFFGRWKALHYAARKFYAPVMLSLRETGTTVEIHVTSDLQKPWEGTVKWQLLTLSGEVLQHGQEWVKVGALKSMRVATEKFELTPDQKREVIMHAELFQEDQPISSALVTFVPNKHLILCDPQLSGAVGWQDDSLEIVISAQSLARFVEVELEGADAVFSDNYFDVMPGETVTVTCPLPDGWTLEQARAALRVRSLWDSF